MMPTLDDFARERMRDPEDRTVGEIRKTDKTVLKTKKKSTSVSLGFYSGTMKVLGFLMMLAVVLLVGYGIYYGIGLYFAE